MIKSVKKIPTRINLQYQQNRKSEQNALQEHNSSVSTNKYQNDQFKKTIPTRINLQYQQNRKSKQNATQKHNFSSSTIKRSSQKRKYLHESTFSINKIEYQNKMLHKNITSQVQLSNGKSGFSDPVRGC